MFVTCKIFLQGIYTKKRALPYGVKMPESINIKLPIQITLENTHRTWLGGAKGTNYDGSNEEN